MRPRRTDHQQGPGFSSCHSIEMRFKINIMHLCDQYFPIDIVYSVGLVPVSSHWSASIVGDHWPWTECLVCTYWQRLQSTECTHSTWPEVPCCYRPNVSSSVVSDCCWRRLVVGTDHIPQNVFIQYGQRCMPGYYRPNIIQVLAVVDDHRWRCLVNCKQSIQSYA